VAVTLRPMTESDFADVVTWLAEPAVRRWWHFDYDLAAVAAKYGPRLRGEEPTRMLVVEADSAPVGLAQWYRWDDYREDRVGYRIGAGELGLDYAVGVPSARSRGVGTELVAALLESLRAEHPAGSPVSVTPEAANVASRRVLDKNGFVHVDTFQRAHVAGRAPEGPTAVYRRLL
jgi:aminoglycoside 6'-N-acetyltransferase